MERTSESGPPRPTGPWATVRTPDDLGRFLARRRIESGWTQQELADYLEIPPRYLHEIESGKHTLAYTRLFSLLRTLGIEARLQVVDSGDDLTLPTAVSTAPAPEPTPRAQDRTSSRAVHVRARPDGSWSVIRDRAVRASSVHDTRAQAERRARALAGAGEVVVHEPGTDDDTSDGIRDTGAFGFDARSRRAADDFFADFDDTPGS